ncbi:DUF6496 domain-containing protein [Legionella nautarum]|nr:DUF6496 domain-containing protein [Legionella nautarum]
MSGRDGKAISRKQTIAVGLSKAWKKGEKFMRRKKVNQFRDKNSREGFYV